MTEPLRPVMSGEEIRIIEDYLNGRSISEIARQIGRSYISVQRFLVANEVPRRPRGGNQRRPRETQR